MSYLGLGLIIVGAIFMLLEEGNHIDKHKKEIEQIKVDFLEVSNAQKKIQKSLDDLTSNVNEQAFKTTAVQSEIDNVQTHLSKTKDSLVKLQMKIVPKKVQVTHVGAIPVEIHSEANGRAKLVDKVKKQIKALEK